ncbi:MAG: N-(5'-phosphoribosyl)anthranilate isomerase, partial [Actinobacteria bacterium]|nr:N-(5'-phosphoribosyl)anthranilate isomerase [Actinomycetota bacterium]
MSIHIKICGITNLAVAQAAVDAGANSLGFVLARSVGEISPPAARAISAMGPAPVESVAVFREPSP